MNEALRSLPQAIRIAASACPHDCPSTCALEVEVLDERTIGRVRGAEDNAYTAGVICAKVARYAERVHHPDRLTRPLRRKGDKDSGAFEPISWDDALDLVAEKFVQAESRAGSQSVWPYYYAGTMGLVMRDGINRLRHVKKYSGFFSTICVNPAWTGFIAGTGWLAGADPREMAKSDLVVIWGTNAVNTQVNVMTHAVRARKERGAKSRALYRRSGRARGAPAREEPRVGRAHHRLRGSDHRSLCAARRREETRVLPARLRLFPLAQRRRQHACGKLYSGGDRRLAA